MLLVVFLTFGSQPSREPSAAAERKYLADDHEGINSTPSINPKTAPISLDALSNGDMLSFGCPSGQVEFPTRHWLMGQLGTCLVDHINQLPSFHTNNTKSTQLLSISCPVD